MDASKAAFTFGRPDLDLLRRFCADRFGWDQDKVDQLIQPVLAVSVAQHTAETSCTTAASCALSLERLLIALSSSFSRCWQPVGPRGMDFFRVAGLSLCAAMDMQLAVTRSGSLAETSTAQPT